MQLTARILPSSEVLSSQGFLSKKGSHTVARPCKDGLYVHRASHGLRRLFWQWRFISERSCALRFRIAVFGFGVVGSGFRSGSSSVSSKVELGAPQPRSFCPERPFLGRAPWNCSCCDALETILSRIRRKNLHMIPYLCSSPRLGFFAVS